MQVWWVARQEATVTLDLGEEAGKVWSVVTTQDQIIAAGDGGQLRVWADDTDTVSCDWWRPWSRDLIPVSDWSRWRPPARRSRSGRWRRTSGSATSCRSGTGPRP